MKMHSILAVALLTSVFPVAAFAADDGFDGPYFTAQAPAALSDNNNAVALSDADAVAAIEPAAGGNEGTQPENFASPQDQAVSEDDYDSVE